MRRAEGRRREEDRQRAGRILHEEIAVGNAPVEDCVGKALVEMDVAKSRGAKEPAVGNGAGPDVDRDRGSREPQREAYGWVPSPGTWEKPSELPLPELVVVGARAVPELGV